VLKQFDVCGTPVREVIEAVLKECGYRRVDGRPEQPGDYYYQHGDAAPGWSDWMWEFEAIELPEHPIEQVLARYRESAKEGAT
jgi:hypothetical protein